MSSSPPQSNPSSPGVSAYISSQDATYTTSNGPPLSHNISMADSAVASRRKMIPILPEAMSSYWRERRAPRDLQFAFCLCSSSNPLMHQLPVTMNLVHPVGGPLQDKWAFACPSPVHDQCETQFVGPIAGGSHFVGSLATTGSPSQSLSKSAPSPSKSSGSPSRFSGSPSKPHFRRATSTRGSGQILLPFTAANFSAQATSTPPRQSFSPDPLSTIMEVDESMNSGNQTWDSIMDTSSGSSAEDSLAIDRYLNRYHAFPRVDDSVETSLGVLPPSVEASLELLPSELRNGPVGDEFMAQLFGVLESEPVAPPLTQPRIMKRSHSLPNLSFLHEPTTVPGICDTDADQSFFDKIIQLGDQKIVSGLSDSDFKDLFEQCHCCNNVMWKCVAYNHQCPSKKGKAKAKVKGDVIDLSDLSG
ncbi:hypothetical protein C8J56DRAFT_896353 [Mycena floridula]|nr:hypothetical protein C8J56DRAFT_896353 [Mycena floridula]